MCAKCILSLCVLRLLCLCVFVAQIVVSCPAVSSLASSGLRALLFTRGPGSQFSLLPDGPGFHNPPTLETTPVKSMLSYPHEPDDRMCVIAKRLGCFHRLAHAAGHGNFLGASASRRTLLLCLFTAATSFHIFGDTCPSGAAARCPAGRVTSVRQRRTSQSNFLESQRHFCNTPSVRHRH